MSHLSKFYRRQRLTSRVEAVGYFWNETSSQSCSPQSSGPKLGGCTAGRMKGDRAVGSTAGAWWRPSSDKCYFYCRVVSVVQNSDVCKYLILHSVPSIHLHLFWMEAKSHKIISIYTLCCHSGKVVLTVSSYRHIYLRTNLSFVRVSMVLASSCVTPTSDSLLMDMSWSPAFSLPS